jgi:hypothetical protein
MYGHPIGNLIKDFYLDEEGIPIPERSNIERYFVAKDGKFLWYDTMEEAVAEHGEGIPRSFRSIRAIDKGIDEGRLKCSTTYLT